MKRIEIPKTELNRLREQLLGKYQTLEGKALRPNSYLGRYEQLKNHIDRSIEGKRDAAISTNVLRKLFYESRDQEALTFNKDYLNALYYFLSDGQKNRRQYLASGERTPFLQGKMMLYLSLALGFMLSLYLFSVLPLNKPPSTLSESFEAIDTKELLSSAWNGWEIKDLDSTFLSQQLREDALTLYTLAGDNWPDLRTNEQPKLPNLFIKRINCRACEIYLRVKDFTPCDAWQQVGIMLYDQAGKTYDPGRFLRFTYAYNADAHDIRNGEQGIGFQIVEKLGQKQIPFSESLILFKEAPTRKFNPITLKIRLYEGTYSFWYSEDGIQFNQLFRSMHKLVEPLYLGIAAFHGMTDAYAVPVGADTIPVFIDQLDLLPL